MHTRERIEPREIVGQLRGSSQPQLIRFSNRVSYVVKFKNNPLGNKALANEYVVSRLARELNLPVPDFQVVIIDKSFIQRHSVLQENAFQAGSQFCTEYLEKCFPFKENPRSIVDRLVNRRDFDNMIVFDQWISNMDRTKRNVLIQPVHRNRLKMYLLDHGNCFPKGRKWTVKSLKKQPVKPVPKSVHKMYGTLFCSPDRLEAFTERIVSFPKEKIKDIVRSIPEDWHIPDAEQRALARHLIKRKKMLPAIMKSFLSAYDS